MVVLPRVAGLSGLYFLYIEFTFTCPYHPKCGDSLMGRFGSFFISPKGIEGWAVRVLTIAVVLMCVAGWLAFNAALRAEEQVKVLEDQVRRDAMNRTLYEQGAKARGCFLLEKFAPSDEELKIAGCR